MGVLEYHQLTPLNKMVELKTHRLCVKNWVEFMVEVQIRIFLMDQLDVQVRIIEKVECNQCLHCYRILFHYQTYLAM